MYSENGNLITLICILLYPHNLKKTGHMNDYYSFSEKVVVLTGGTCFMGESVARYLAGLGAFVVILGQSLEFGQKVISEIKEDGGEATFFITDFSNQEAIKKNLQDILLEYGRIDVLINDFSEKIDYIDNFNFDFLKKTDVNVNNAGNPYWTFLNQIIKQSKGTILNLIYCSCIDENHSCSCNKLSEFTNKLANELNQNNFIDVKVNSVDFGCVNKKDICSEYQANKILSPVFKEISLSQNGIMLNIKSDTIYA